jgi:hypothetical protein
MLQVTIPQTQQSQRANRGSPLQTTADRPNVGVGKARHDETPIPSLPGPQGQGTSSFILMSLVLNFLV